MPRPQRGGFGKVKGAACRALTKFMTWLDITLIVVWIIFLAVGARLGSLWMGACVMAGFIGTVLVDYYTLPFSQMLGDFTGASFLAGTLLFLGTLLVVLIPAHFLKRISSLLFLGVIDSAIGMMTGALTGLIAISMVLLLIVPQAPQVEKSRAWKKSKIVKPYHKFLEELFHSSRFRPKRITRDLKKKALKQFKPVTKKVKKALKSFK